MANAYSILHNYHQDLYSPDYNLIGSVLQYKQGKLDANRQKLQSLYDKLSVIDVAKSEDKEYIEGRLQAAQEIVNKYSAMDLSNDGFANNLIEQLSVTIDDNVKNAVIGTRIYRAEQAAWEKLKEENFELYNEGNRKFAQQGSDAWLTDGKAGTKYRGGGGVIEYDDYQKRWQESIPDIAKALGDNYEYVTHENGVGMFIDKVTKRAVDRGTISGIMDNILGEKGRRQQMIDAWNQYDGVDPLMVKEQYDDFLGVKIDEANRHIENLKNILPNKVGSEREQYQQALDSWQARKNSYVSSSFDNLVRTNPEGGVRTAYQTMFSAQAKEPWLGVYTYGEKVVNREVDDNHVKSLEFQEKVRQFNLNYDLKVRELDMKRAKVGGGRPTSGGGVIEYDERGIRTIVEQDLQELWDEEETSSNISKYQGQHYDGIKDLKDVVGNLSQAKLIDIGAQLEGKDLSNVDEITLNIGGKEKTFSFGEYKVVDGVETWVPNGNRKKLLSFMSKSYGTDPVVKQIRNNIRESITELEDRLVEEYAVNPGIASDFAKFNREIVRVGGSDKEPVYKVQWVKNGDRYKQLLKKAGEGKKLSDAEQMTLDLYVTSHFIADPEVDNAIKREAYVGMRNDLVKAIGYQEFEKLPQSYRSISGKGLERGGAETTVVANEVDFDQSHASRYTTSDPVFSKVLDAVGGRMHGGDRFPYSPMIVPKGSRAHAKSLISKFTDYVQAQGSEKTRLKQELYAMARTAKRDRTFITQTSSNDDAYLSQLGFYDTETDSGGKMDFSSLIKNTNTTLDAQMESLLEASYLAPEVPQYMIREEDSRYDALADLIQAKQGERPKGPITFALDVTAEGKRKGGIIYQYTNKEGEIINSVEEDLEAIPEVAMKEIGLPFASTARTPYDAKFGSNAPKVQLGGSKPSSKVSSRVGSELAKNQQVLAMNDSNSVRAILSLAGDVSPIKKAEVAQEIIDFREGKYYFTLEASDVDRQYKMMMYKGGELIDQRTISDSFSEEDLSLFLGNYVNPSSGDYGALYYKHAMFNDYLNNHVLDSEVDRDLKISQIEVAEFLRTYGQQ